jgi:hypothetical protein
MTPEVRALVSTDGNELWALGYPGFLTLPGSRFKYGTVDASDNNLLYLTNFVNRVT